jgi:pseudaminic acid biosynthesis-associated methylase
VPPDDNADNANRLEALWSGDFGDNYVDRNRAAGEGRAPFWKSILEKTRAKRVLEVGCNVGANLRWIAAELGPDNAWGIDVNQKALDELKRAIPLHAIHASARALPFDDGTFDLVFTMGVLIHQAPEALPDVMREIVRTSRRYVLCGEYYAATPTEVPYRGESGALFKRDFGGDYLRLFPQLAQVETGFLARGDATWDDITWWLFEKPSARQARQ